MTVSFSIPVAIQWAYY